MRGVNYLLTHAISTAQICPGRMLVPPRKHGLKHVTAIGWVAYLWRRPLVERLLIEQRANRNVGHVRTFL